MLMISVHWVLSVDAGILQTGKNNVKQTQQTTTTTQKSINQSNEQKTPEQTLQKT